MCGYPLQKTPRSRLRAFRDVRQAIRNPEQISQNT